jgi:hypothetical protein
VRPPHVAALAIGLFCASPSLAVAPTLKPKLVCQTLPKMVLCAVHLEASVGAWVSWSQAEIVEAPAFVRPVHTKVTYKKNPLKRPAIYLGLSPTGGGKGEVAIVLRTVVCPDARDGQPCAHLSQRLQTTISVPLRSAR